MGSRKVPAARFKAECLALLDRVAETGETLVVTKRGRPVARVVPIEVAKPNSLIGSVQAMDDLISPIDVRWEAEE